MNDPLADVARRLSLHDEDGHAECEPDFCEIARLRLSSAPCIDADCAFGSLIEHRAHGGSYLRVGGYPVMDGPNRIKTWDSEPPA